MQQVPGEQVVAEAFGPGIFKRVMTARVPVWALMVAVAVVAVAFGIALVAQARSAVHLGRAVGVAQQMKVEMTLCNRDVDREQINPRTAELDLEKLLRQQGAHNANVVVDRQDCPRTP